MQRLARWLLRLRGWKVIGSLPPDIKKFVVIAAPHTSNWDFPTTLIAAIALHIRAKWMGKKVLFQFPIGGLMRTLGGIAVDRSKHTNMVEYAANLLKTSDRLGLIIPVEGTRSKSSKWKTGFYYIASAADVPIVCGFMDYTKKEVGIGLILLPTGDIHVDIVKLRDFYSGIQGKYPEQTAPVEI
jgi:1-acyl-sn-glycerol-3-phosphate acyltransferase